MCEKVLILFNEKIIDSDKPSLIDKKYECSSLNEVFNKIFTRKNRKTYQESNKEKTIVEPVKKKEIKTLSYDKDKLDELIEEASKKEDSDSILKRLKDNGN
jgi:predicted nucleotidyltransferase